MKTLMLMILSFTCWADMTSLPKLRGVLDNQTELKNSKLTLSLTLYKMKKLGPILGHGEETPVAIRRLTRKIKEDGSFKFPTISISTSGEWFIGMTIQSEQTDQIMIMAQAVCEFMDESWLPLPMAISYLDIEITEDEYLGFYQKLKLFGDKDGGIFFTSYGDSNYQHDNKPQYLRGVK